MMSSFVKPTHHNGISLNYESVPKRHLIYEHFWYLNAGILSNSLFEKAVLYMGTCKLNTADFTFILFLGLKYLIHYIELFTFDHTPLLFECITKHLKYLQALIGTHSKSKKYLNYRFINKLQHIFENLRNVNFRDFACRQMYIDQLERLCNFFATRLNMWIKSPRLQAYLFRYGFDPYRSCVFYNSFLIPNQKKYVDPLCRVDQKFLDKIEMKCNCKIMLSIENLECYLVPEYVMLEVLFDLYRGNYIGFIEMFGYIVKRLNSTQYFAKSLRTVIIEGSILYNILTNVPVRKLKYLERTIVAGSPVTPFLSSNSISKQLFSIIAMIREQDPQAALVHDLSVTDESDEGSKENDLDYFSRKYHSHSTMELGRLQEEISDLKYSQEVLKYFQAHFNKTVKEQKQQKEKEKIFLRCEKIMLNDHVELMPKKTLSPEKQEEVKEDVESMKMEESVNENNSRQCRRGDIKDVGCRIPSSKNKSFTDKDRCVKILMNDHRELMTENPLDSERQGVEIWDEVEESLKNRKRVEDRERQEQSRRNVERSMTDSDNENISSQCIRRDLKERDCSVSTSKNRSVTDKHHNKKKRMVLGGKKRSSTSDDTTRSKIGDLTSVAGTNESNLGRLCQENVKEASCVTMDQNPAPVVDFETLSPKEQFKLLLQESFEDYQSDHNWVAHKMRLMLRCDTDETVDDVKHPFLYEKRSIRDRIRNRNFMQKVLPKPEPLGQTLSTMSAGNSKSWISLAASKILSGEIHSLEIEDDYSTSNSDLSNSDILNGKDLKMRFPEIFVFLEKYGKGILDSFLKKKLYKKQDWVHFLSKQLNFSISKDVMMAKVCDFDYIFGKVCEKQATRIEKVKDPLGKKIFALLLLLTKETISDKDFRELQNGKGIDLAIIDKINQCQPSVPSYIGNLDEYKSKDLLPNMSRCLCQMMYDLIQISHESSRDNFYILQYHIAVLNDIISKVDDPNIKAAFTMLNIRQDLMALNFKTYNRNGGTASQMIYMAEELSFLHDIVFKQPCCAYKISHHLGLHILYHSAQIDDNIRAVEPFLKLPGDRRIKKIEKICNCIIALKTKKHPTINMNEYIVEIFYDFDTGNHFGAIELLKQIMSCTKKLIQNHRTLVAYPSGELWVFRDTEWLKKCFNVNENDSKGMGIFRNNGEPSEIIMAD